MRHRLLVSTLAFASSVALFSAEPPAAAAPQQNRNATVVFFTDANDKPVQEIEFADRKVKVLSWQKAPPGYVGRVVLAGRYHRIGWKLLVQKLNLPPTPDGRFLVSFPLHKFGARIVLEAFGPAGQRERESVQVVAEALPDAPAEKKKEIPLAEDVVVAAPGAAPVESEDQGPWRRTAGLFLQTFHFTQPDLVSADQLWLSAHLAAGYQLTPRRWEASAEGELSALSLRRTPADTTLRMLETSLVGERIWTISQNDWQWRVGGGGRFVTSFVDPGDFGPAYLIAPQIQTAIAGPLFGRNGLGLSVVFSPLFVSQTHGLNSYLRAEIDYLRALEDPSKRWHVWLRWDAYRIAHEQGDFSLSRTTVGLGYEW